MLESLDKKKIIIITSIAIAFVIIVAIIIKINMPEKQIEKIDELALKAELSGDSVELSVETKKDKNISYFIEESEDVEFTKATPVKNSNNKEKILVEGSPNTTMYYRVRQEDNETKEVTYSNIICISNKEDEIAQENDKENTEKINGEIDGSELIIESRSKESSSSKSIQSITSSSLSSNNNYSEKISSSQSSSLISSLSSRSSSKLSSSSSSYKNNYDSSEYNSETYYEVISSRSSSSKNTNTNKNTNTSTNTSTSTNTNKNTNTNTTTNKNTNTNTNTSTNTNKNTNTSTSTNTNTNTNIEIINRADAIEVKSIKLSATTVELDISGKNTKTLTVTINPENATEKEITWSSEDENIVKVDENGTITAMANGNTNIIAKVGKKQAKCRVKVITTATNIKLDKEEIKLDVTTNKEEKIEAKVEPETATNNKITWTSEDTKIARVDSKGVVTGISNGKTKIITKVGTITKECEVTVETSPKSIKLSDTSIELDINQNNQQTLETKILPSTSNIYTKITWKSSNTKVATVDARGKVTAIGEGIATITAAIKGKTEINASAQVVVNSTVSNIMLNKKNIEINLLSSSETKIIAKLKNGERYKTATWKSSNESVAKVKGEGLTATVTAVGAGTSTITLTVDGKTAICGVTAVKGQLSLSKTNNNVLDAYGSDKTQIIINNQKDIQFVKYTSSDPKIATVDSNGVVTGKGGGKATITVETDKGIGKCEVNVWYKAGFRKETYTYQNDTIGYFIYIPEVKNIDISSGISMIMYFPGYGDAHADWNTVGSTLDGLCSISRDLASGVGECISRKSEFNSIIVSINGADFIKRAEALNSFAGYIEDTYGVNRKKVHLVGFSYGSIQIWEIASFATKNSYKNLQFASITSIGTPGHSNRGNLISTIKRNDVNTVPVYVVRGNGDGNFNSVQSTLFVDMGTTNKLSDSQIGLYNTKNNNVAFSSRYYYINTEHTKLAKEAFTKVNNQYNLIKWILQQERTTIY